MGLVAVPLVYMVVPATVMLSWPWLKDMTAAPRVQVLPVGYWVLSEGKAMKLGWSITPAIWLGVRICAQVWSWERVPS